MVEKCDFNPSKKVALGAQPGLHKTSESVEDSIGHWRQPKYERYKELFESFEEGLAEVGFPA